MCPKFIYFIFITKPISIFNIISHYFNNLYIINYLIKHYLNRYSLLTYYAIADMKIHFCF